MLSTQKRPKVLSSTTAEVECGCGKMFVTVSFSDGKPFEVFAVLGKSGTCSKVQTQAITRCITLGLRSGVQIEEYLDQLAKSGMCTSPINNEDGFVQSCPTAIKIGIEQILAQSRR